ncbi:MAG: protein kinase [Gemmatimonadetes bacterium]|nr:protein kinase [Gemmatimonadota bacterium]
MSDRVTVLNRALEGRYEIEREIGAGGMAVVYLARDLKHDRHVALKSLRPELASSVGGERFLREIQLSARLSHPHILTLIDSGQAGDVLFFVLPYVEGESLREWIARDAGLPLEDAVRIAEQVASALTYAHEQGVVHRDIKPENILIHGGEAQVSDFGIAVGLEAAQSERLTVSGFSIGSPVYMSPEQADGGSDIDQRSDIYSFGCLVYEMIAGHPPFAADSTRTLVAQILTKTPDRLDAVDPDVPKGVADAVERALAREPEGRFETADAFARALVEGMPQPVGSAPPARAPWLVAAAALVGLAAWFLIGPGGAGVAELEAVNAVEGALAEADFVGAYRLMASLPPGVPDSVRDRLHAEGTLPRTVLTEPAGAEVSWRPLLDPDAPWEPLGPTPLSAVVPQNHVLLRLQLEGYETRHLWSHAATPDVTWPLRPEGSDPANALWVPGGQVNPGVLAGGIWQGDARTISDYLLDRFEVTNEQYQAFVDAGGYEREEFWEHDFVGGDRRVTRSEAMASFVDRTGRPGPSTWDVGRYPDGTADHPVTGISWFEAAAFARFVGRSLPTMYHWYHAAFVQRGEAVVPHSNIDGTRLAPVGSFQGITLSGASDMAGNAREWVQNKAGEYRLTVGGGWRDPSFAFGLAQPIDPFQRSDVNGLRLITDLGDGDLLAAAGNPVAFFERDFAAESPASDEVFDVFLDLYRYDRTELNAQVEVTDTLDSGIIRERITFDAGYDGPRMVLYLFLPPEEERVEPLQTVVYFPGSNVLNARPFDTQHAVAGPLSRSRLIVRSGRAFAYPVYLSTFDRDDDFVYLLQDESNDYRDHVIKWYKDLARSLDYLETRDELDPEKVGYLGYSWGARTGAIMLAVESRLKTGIMTVAGLSPKPTQPAVDPFHFASRVDVPVLVISGEFDPIYPMEMSARPFFEALGTDVKQHYIGPGAHFVPYPDFARETLAWLDRYLGPVR